MNEAVPIVVSGSMAVDRIMNFRGRYQDEIMPDRLHTISISKLLDSLYDTRGGAGANIAYSLGILGARPILLTSVGPESDDYVKFLKDAGVETQYIHRSHLGTASFNVITDSDQNQIGGFYSGAMLDSDYLSFLPYKHLDPIFTISPQDPKAMPRLASECIKHHLRLFYDPGQQVTNLDGKSLAIGVEAAELLILNHYEMGVLAKKTGLSPDTIKQKIPVVVTTQGKNGSLIEGAAVNNPITVGIAKAERMADPTGAGDAYRAGFLYGYSRGWELKVCGQLAAVVASYSIEHMGPQEHRFTHADVQARYKNTFQESLILK